MQFEKLDKKIQDWLSSTLVVGIVVELNDALNTVGPEVRMIPQAIRSLVTGGLKPELFTQKLKQDLFFLSDKEVANTVISIKNRILKPIAGPLKTQLTIDIEKISTVIPPPAPAPIAPPPVVLKPKPAAVVTKLTPPPAPVVRPQPIAPPKPIVQAIKPPAPTPVARETQFERPKPVSPSPVAQPKPTAAQTPQATTEKTGPKARVMEFAQMTDVRKPVNQPSVGQSPVSQLKQKPAEPTASTAPKPFGLSETTPQAPEPHDLMKYQDEHPMKEE